MTKSVYTEDEVRTALNEAANDIQGYNLAAEQHAIVDLTVNVALAYLDGTAQTVPDAIDASYSEEPAEVLGWCGIDET